MPDGELFRGPDENSGPAVLGREPILLPKARKNTVNRVKDAFDMD